MSKGFKGSMSSFYHEARAQVKAIKERSIANKNRNEAKREVADAEREHPLHYLRADGRSCRLLRNDAAFYSQQQGEGLMPWAGDHSVRIDRYDVRALIDSYVAPPEGPRAKRARTTAEVELEELVGFEAYRDLIRLKTLGLSDGQGIRHAEQENVAVRAQARTAAVAAVTAAQEAAAGPRRLPSQNSAFQSAGPATFVAVGYSYGAEGGEGEQEEEEEEGGEEEGDFEDDSDEDVPATAEDADMDRTALRDFGLEEFSSMLKWSMRQEQDEADARSRSRRPAWSRKKAALRSRRLVGQGLDPSRYLKPPPPAGNELSWIPEVKAEDLQRRFGTRDSPEYGEGGRRSPSPATRTAGGGAGGGGAPAFREALPGMVDPGVEGPALLPAEAVRLHGVRAGERPRGDGEPRYGSVSGRQYGRAKPPAPAPAAAPALLAAVRPLDKSKETPQERLKRLMAAQLNKKIAKDHAVQTSRRQAEEAERSARLANEAGLAPPAGGSGRYDSESDEGWDDDGRREPRSRRRRQRSRSPRARSRDRGGGSGGGYGASGGGRGYGGGGGRSRSQERGSRPAQRSRSRSRDRHRGSSRRSPSPHYRSSRR